MKKKELYLDTGYLNVKSLIGLPVHHIYCIGARGVGKTYGFLEYFVESGISFLLIRRSQSQIDIVCSQEMNVFESLNIDKGWNILGKHTSKYIYSFYDTRSEDGKLIYALDKKPYGYAAALSTFANIRGFDGTKIEIILYDEFIPEESAPAMRGEANSFFNMLETVNRNRFKKGMDSIKLICLSNSTEAANPIFLELGIVSKVMRQNAAGEYVYLNQDREIAVVMPKDSPISDEKAQTPLYKMTQGTSFYDSAIKNEFINNVPTSVRSRPIKEYIPKVNVGELCVYKHKSNGRIYVSTHQMNGTPSYRSTEKELMIFRRQYMHLMRYVYSGKIDYEDYACEILFDKYMNMCYI